MIPTPRGRLARSQLRRALPVAAAALATALASVPAPPLAAQTVRGEVVEAGTGAPVPAAFVTILDPAGERVAGTLTDASGRFTIAARTPGRYALRVERLGHESLTTAGFDLAAGEFRTERIDVVLRAIDLDGIAVEATGGACALPHDVGAETHLLWEEVRKALEITVWTEERGAPPYHAVNFQRSRDLVTTEILSDHAHELQVRSGNAGPPFEAVRPEALVAEGFVRQEADGSITYFGLDAHTLLSDAFLDTHCFRVRTRDAPGPGLVGLGFEPLPDRTLPEVSGVLWLDRESHELRMLDYTYTTHLHLRDVPRSVFGGRTEFRRLADGAWLVDRWHIRMPQLPERSARGETSFHMATDAVGRDARAAARASGLTIREEGGFLHTVIEPSTEPASGGAAIGGVVRDETRNRPLGGATVFVAGHSRTARTRPDGTFQLTGLPEGRHEVAFFHPRTDQLALPPQSAAVDLREGRPSHVTLAIPAEAACPPDDPEHHPTTGVAGFAVHRGSGEPVPEEALVVSWSRPLGRTLFEALRGIDRVERGRIEVVTDTTGRFLACGIPVGATIWAGREGGTLLEIDAHEPGLMRRDLLVR